MPDKPQKAVATESKTGVMRITREVAEPNAQHEPPPPPSLPEFADDGATTGKMSSLLSEGKDRSAALDSDSGAES
ncbi:MAG: hypothetical protein HXY40_00505 [Chloroflexi bacterium]|nr:hypothetical protein [Chloroflexota bacterium]